MSSSLQQHSIVTSLSDDQLLQLLRDTATQASRSQYAFYPHPESPAAFSAALQATPSSIAVVVLFRIEQVRPVDARRSPLRRPDQQLPAQLHDVVIATLRKSQQRIQDRRGRLRGHGRSQQICPGHGPDAECGRHHLDHLVDLLGPGHRASRGGLPAASGTGDDSLTTACSRSR